MSTVEEQEQIDQAERDQQERDDAEQRAREEHGGNGDPGVSDLPVEVDLDVDLDEDAELHADEVAVLGNLPDADLERLMEERGKKLDKLGGYVAKKLVEIFGEEEADALELCELCQWTHTYGWRVDVVPPPAVRDAVKRAIGLGTIDEMKSYDAFATCATCDGLGNVKTGSQVTEFLYRQCPSCHGRGYSSSLADDSEQSNVRPIVAAMPVAEGQPPQAPDYDMFGTPAGHPDYGKLAQHREVPISAWAGNLPQS